MVSPARFVEVELKFSLQTNDAATLEARLARTTILRRRTVTHLHLHNVYYDTPDQLLRRRKVVLRVRQIGSAAAPMWVQTLKVGASDESALSRRGEWESPSDRGVLDRSLLTGTPWIDLDPHGELFQSLAPCFVTVFDRTSWTVKKRDGSAAEISLDRGYVKVGGESAPICELEIELLAGTPDLLFDVAGEIAKTVPLIPSSVSKSERGYALAKGTLYAPLPSRPHELSAGMAWPEMACAVLRESFCQFTGNLAILGQSDGARVDADPEVLHQARVGWRRFKTALHLFNKRFALDPVPSIALLKPLLTAMARMRDLDVATSQTLPMVARAYTAGNADREYRWRAMEQLLAQATQKQQRVFHDALQHARVGATLVALTRWLESIPSRHAAEATTGNFRVADWARRRVTRFYKQLKTGLADSQDPKLEHRSRILAKRLRYAIEALRPLLPKRRAMRWHRLATHFQTRLGASRDLLNAAEIIQGLECDAGLTEFLRGLSAGHRMDSSCTHPDS